MFTLIFFCIFWTIIEIISQDNIFPSRISRKFNRPFRFWSVLPIDCCGTLGCLECPSQSYRCLHYFVKYTSHHLLYQECQFAHAHQLPYSKPSSGRLPCRLRFCARLARAHLQRRRPEFYLVYYRHGNMVRLWDTWWSGIDLPSDGPELGPPVRNCLASEASLIHQNKVSGYYLYDMVTCFARIWTISHWKQGFAESVQHVCHMHMLFLATCSDLRGTRNNSHYHKTQHSKIQP